MHSIYHFLFLIHLKSIVRLIEAKLIVKIEKLPTQIHNRYFLLKTLRRKGWKNFAI